jgi:Paired amphipathic helix repeat
MSSVIHQVSYLFRVQPSLIEGFNNFLPAGYRLEAGPEDNPDAIKVTVPEGTTLFLHSGPGAPGADGQEAQGVESTASHLAAQAASSATWRLPSRPGLPEVTEWLHAQNQNTSASPQMGDVRPSDPPQQSQSARSDLGSLPIVGQFQATPTRSHSLPSRLLRRHQRRRGQAREEPVSAQTSSHAPGSILEPPNLETPRYQPHLIRLQTTTDSLTSPVHFARPQWRSSTALHRLANKSPSPPQASADAAISADFYSFLRRGRKRSISDALDFREGGINGADAYEAAGMKRRKFV